MSGQDQNSDDALWKALDAHPEVKPHPQTKARVWALIARGDAEATGFRWQTLLRYALPAAALAGLILTFTLGGVILLEKRKADLEISENLELYENYEVIRNMGQLASYDDVDEQIFESIK